MKKESKARGFSLVELMVAMAVFIVMAMAVGGLLLAVSDTADNDEELRIASMDLQTVMETINGTPFDSIVTTYPDGLMVPAYYDLNLSSEILTVSYADPAATSPLQIVLQVSWTGQKGVQKTRTLNGLRVR